MAIVNGTAGNDNLGGTAESDQIFGLAGNDILFGIGGDDLLDGGDDHDALRGADGNDHLIGGDGDDFLRGDDFGVGDDIIDGGAGWDRVSYAVGASAGVTVDLNIQGVAQNTGSKGNDILIGIEHLTGTIFSDTLTGNGGDNWLWGGSNGSGVTGDDVISAGAGNDLVEVGAGNHLLDGGSGIDSLSLWGNDADIGAAGVTVSLLLQGAAQATEQGSMTLAGFENLSGSKHDDGLTGDASDNVLAGDQGNDILVGGAGSDTLYGDGRIIADTHDTGGSGPITTYSDISTVYPELVAGDDTLEGGEGNDVLNGGGGSDTASYANAAGAVQVFLSNGGGGSASGADGNDSLISIENVTGSEFDDQIIGNNSDNLLAGGDGHDYLRSAGGDDILLGGNGDDYLGGGFGNDLLDGGAGVDRVAFFHNAVAGVTVDLNIQGVAQNTGQGMDTLIGIEHASGTTFADTLIGTGGDNWLWGEGGNDSFTAGGGNDLVQVATGDIVADGGTGTDSFSMANNGVPLASGVSVSLALQGGAQATSLGALTLTGFENLSGTSYDDMLTGDGGDNVLAGDEGNDTLAGGDGSDTLYGDGRITIVIHSIGTSGPIVTHPDVTTVFPDLVVGNDTLNGGKGNDRLVGGGGDDMLTGGAGEDLFLFGPGSGDDVVTDMAKKDLISIVGMAGVDDFSDLTIAAGAGGSSVISWGTTDSITLLGMKPKQVSAAMFAFEDPAAAASLAASSFAGGDMLAPADFYG